MFGMKIVVQKDSVVGISAQELLCMLYVIGHINKIAFETRRKPAMPSLVIVQEKNSNWMALNLYFAEAEFA
jgi:hypothetical protein